MYSIWFNFICFVMTQNNMHFNLVNYGASIILLKWIYITCCAKYAAFNNS